MHGEMCPVNALPTVLPAGEVYVWLLNPADLVDRDVYQAAVRLLSESERAKAQRFRVDADRLAYVGAHALARIVLGAYSAFQSPASVTFASGKFGKPLLALPAGRQSLGFSISHTRGMTACAAAWNRDVGVDVERIRDAPLAITEQFMASSEVRAIRSLPDSQRVDAFFALWTLKEAFVKAQGDGLDRPLDSFAFSLWPAELVADDRENIGRRQWHFTQVSPAAGFVLALCVSSCTATPPTPHFSWLPADVLIRATEQRRVPATP